MKSILLTAFASLVILASASHPHKPRRHVRGMPHIPDDGGNGLDTVKNSTFSQLIDHSNPSLGTFEQFYYYDTTYYKGPGSPVVLSTPGEANVTGYTNYLVDNRTTGVVAKEIGAATIVIEHRYWGTSTPFINLTTENMKYLTLENSILDLTYFARHVKLPFDTSGSSNAASAPWVLMGGSYSGALSAWTESVAPGTFWAYHASSAPVEAISDYWGYFLPVQEGMPKNCSADVNLVIEHMDEILKAGNASEIHNLKAMFGLESVEHNDDFMAALEWAPWLWQDNQFYENGGFFTWCDYIENSVNVTNSSALPGAEGVGLEKALAGYAKWGKEYYFPGFCYTEYGYDYDPASIDTGCFSTYNASSPLFTDTSLSNTVDRQWVWMTCNEPFGYWQDGAPEGHPTLVSRTVNAEYWIRQCNLYFPPGPNGETFGINKGRTESDVNAYTGGWNIGSGIKSNSTSLWSNGTASSAHRLIYANGGYDPWREAGVSSELRPGGPMQSTAQTPINIVPGGFHTSDLVTKNGEVNAGCKAVIDAEVAQLVKWVGEWPGYANGTKKHGAVYRYTA